MSEKYVNYYIELLTNTMQDAVLRNVSLQTNLKISDEAIGELNQKVEELENIVENLRNETTNSQQNASNEVKKISEDKDKIINDLRNKINNLSAMQNEYENIKHQVQHVDTFRNELNKERNEHQKTRDVYELKLKELQDQIEYLQLPPAKRKKIESSKNIVVETPTLLNILTKTDITEDGGTF
jgi:chromosome segregation ATPase